MALALESSDKNNSEHILTLIKDNENFDVNINEIELFLENNYGLQKAEELQEMYLQKSISELKKLSGSEDLIGFTEMIGKRKY